MNTPSLPRVVVLVCLMACLATSPVLSAAPSPVDGFNIWQANGVINAMAVQSDGKIVLGGQFTKINGTAANYLARLNPDGTLDTTFSIGVGPSYFVMDIAVQPDGKIIIAGSFSKYNNAAHRCLARLNPDGSADATFNPVIDSQAAVTRLAIQSDGKILVGGEITGSVYSNLMRLNPDGSDDASFSRVTLTPANGVRQLNALLAAPGGEIYLAGQFSAVNGVGRLRVARITGNGVVDAAFNPDNAVSGIIYALALQRDGKLLAGGYARADFKRFNRNGSVDPTFNPGNVGEYVKSLTIQPDGEILVGADPYLVRLRMDGSTDSGFAPVAGSEQGAAHVALLANGKILLGNGYLLYPDGRLDSTFNSEPGADLEIKAIARQSDGKIIIGGSFTNVNGTARNHIARLNADGTLDLSFDPRLDLYGPITRVCIQKDGKIVLNEYLWAATGSRDSVIRLDAGGSIDPGFTTGDGFNAEVKSITETADGKLLVAGNFTGLGNTPAAKIVRLNQNGTIDPAFSSSLSPGDLVAAMQIQTNGKIVIGGHFQDNYYTLRRLNASGSLDTTFKSVVSNLGFIDNVVLQPDGKIIAAGYDEVEAEENWRLAYRVRFIKRLAADGSVDGSFHYVCNVNYGVQDIPVFLALQPNGGIVISNYHGFVGPYARSFPSAASVPPATAAAASSDSPYSIKRITSTGAPDNSFTTCSLTSQANQLLVLPDGKIMAAGSFDAANGIVCRKIARLNAAGTIDRTFNATGSGVDNSVFALAVQPDSKVLAGGLFTSFNGEVRNHAARLTPEGWADSTFCTTTSTNGSVYCAAALPDGKMLLGGSFSDVSGLGQGHLARLSADGTLDTTFSAGTDGTIYAMCIQQNGRVLIGGNFTIYGGRQNYRLARVSVDGTNDMMFNINSGFDGTVQAVTVQPSGKIIVGGAFSTFDGNLCGHIARLQSNGSIDSKFTEKSGANDSVNALLIQPDGRIIVAGAFTQMNGIARNRIARLNEDGSLDVSFVPGSGANGEVKSLALQADGKIIISGSFTAFNGVSRNRVARLNKNGSLDVVYDPGSGASAAVQAVVLQTDGKLLMGGDFALINGSLRSRLARLSSPEPAGQSISVTDGIITLALTGSSPVPYQVMFETSSDGIAWNQIGWGTPVSGVGFRLTKPNLPIVSIQYLRATGYVSGGLNNGSISLFRSSYWYYPEKLTRNAARDWMYFE